MIRGLRKTGFTIIEATLSVAIVGILLVASTATFGAIARLQRVQAERRMAYALAGQLMGEILQQRFQDQSTPAVFGPQAGETRPTLSDVDDYNGYSSSPPVAQNGAALAGYVGWTEAVTVMYVDPNNPSLAINTSTLKRITITVTSPGSKQYQLVGLRSQFGAYEGPSTSLTNYVTGVTVGIQTGSSNTGVYTTAHPLNVTTSQ